MQTPEALTRLAFWVKRVDPRQSVRFTYSKRPAATETHKCQSSWPAPFFDGSPFTDVLTEIMMRCSLAIGVFLAGLGPLTALAQPAAPVEQAAPPQNVPPPADADSDEPQVGNSGVGYIDPAFIANVYRFRYDDVYGNVAPSRAEFFWPIGPPFGPGPKAEKRVDYQDFSNYLEYRVQPGFSVFGEVPLRLVNPTVNANTGGPGDVNFGFKWLVDSSPDHLLTFQLRTYAPTGDGDRGLGTRHFSVEPALLGFRRLAPRWTMEGELRDWNPIGGTPDVQGNIVRYGIGTGYWLYDSGPRRLIAVTEFVGWTVLSGGVGEKTDQGVVHIQDAVGTTIVNAKVGLRWCLDQSTSLYAGYGRALTTDIWYSDTFRFELRHCF
jgi:hypothetical protein